MARHAACGPTFRFNIPPYNINPSVCTCCCCCCCQALAQASAGRAHILSQMELCSPPPARGLSKFAPRVVQMKIPQDKLGALIGPVRLAWRCGFCCRYHRSCCGCRGCCYYSLLLGGVMGCCWRCCSHIWLLLVLKLCVAAAAMFMLTKPIKQPAGNKHDS